jgi:DNA-binding transcriptional ArsR family regulator
LSYVRQISTVSAETEAATLDYEAAETLLVSEPEQLRALADPLRSKITGLLRERAWSTQQLARELGLPKGTVGHHLKVLERAGLIRVVRTRQVRAVTEKFYGRVGRLFLFQIEDPADARALGAATLRDAAGLIERAPEGASWGMVLSRLSEKDALRFERRLDKLIDDFRKSETPGGVAHRLVGAFWRVEKPDA